MSSETELSTAPWFLPIQITVTLILPRKYAAAAELYCMGLQHPDMDALVTCFHYLTRQASDIRLSHSRSARHLVHMIETKLVVLYYKYYLHTCHANSIGWCTIILQYPIVHIYFSKIDTYVSKLWTCSSSVGYWEVWVAPTQA